MSGLNGMHANPPGQYAPPPAQPPAPPHYTVDTPLVTITPPAIRLTGAQIWTAILSIPATVAMLASLGIFYVPAKEVELQALVAVVQTVQKAQEDSSAAVRRLTEAVDNLSSLVVKLPKPKNLSGAVRPR